MAQRAVIESLAAWTARSTWSAGTALVAGTVGTGGTKLLQADGPVVGVGQGLQSRGGVGDLGGVDDPVVVGVEGSDDRVAAGARAGGHVAARTTAFTHVGTISLRAISLRALRTIGAIRDRIVRGAFGALRTEFFTAESAILVGIQRKQCGGRGGDFGRAQDSVLVGVERLDQRRHHAGAGAVHAAARRTGVVLRLEVEGEAADGEGGQGDPGNVFHRMSFVLDLCGPLCPASGNNRRPVR